MAASSKIPVMPHAKPKNKSNRKLIILLMLFFITILLLLFFHSPFSRITSIEISGNRYVTEAQVLEASGIRLDDHFFIASEERIRDRVLTLGIVEDAIVTKRFPGHVMIEVIEYPEVAYQILPDGTPEALLASGVALPIKGTETIIDKPILSGWDDEELKTRLTHQLANIPDNLLADISEIQPSPSDAYPDKIVMYTRSNFQIITTIEKLPEKAQLYRIIINDQLSQGVEGGVLTLLEADKFSPYPSFEDTLTEEESSLEQLASDDE